MARLSTLPMRQSIGRRGQRLYRCGNKIWQHSDDGPMIKSAFFSADSCDSPYAG
jgi:hypothetical protein